MNFVRVYCRSTYEFILKIRLRFIFSKQHIPWPTALSELLISLIALAMTSLTAARWYQVDARIVLETRRVLEVLRYTVEMSELALFVGQSTDYESRADLKRRSVHGLIRTAFRNDVRLGGHICREMST